MEVVVKFCLRPGAEGMDGVGSWGLRAEVGRLFEELDNGVFG